MAPRVGSNLVAGCPRLLYIIALCLSVHCEKGDWEVASIGILEARSGLVDEAQGDGASCIIVREQNKLRHLVDW